MKVLVSQLHAIYNIIISIEYVLNTVYLIINTEKNIVYNLQLKLYITFIHENNVFVLLVFVCNKKKFSISTEFTYDVRKNMNFYSLILNNEAKFTLKSLVETII